MADVTLTVVTEKSDDIDLIIFAINGKNVPLVRDKGTETVSGSGPHKYNYWIVGAPGGTASYEIKHGDKVVLAKKQRTIRAGKRFARGGNTFPVS